MRHGRDHGRLGKIRRCAGLAFMLAAAGACAPRVEPDPNLLAGRMPVEVDGVRDVELITDGRMPQAGSDWLESAARFDTAGSSVTYDLGEPQPIRAAYLQSNHDGKLQLSVSTDGRSYTNVWVVGRVKRPGLRPRHIRKLDCTARYVRLAATRGDDRFSVSELQLFGTVPEPWPPLFARNRIRIDPRCQPGRHPAPRPVRSVRDLDRPPLPAPALSLLDLPGEVIDGGTAGAGDAPLAAYGRAELAAWSRGRSSRSPVLGPGMEAAVRMELTLLPGRSTAIRFTPRTKEGPSHALKERRHRTSEIPLPARKEGESTTISIDIERLVSGNWGMDAGLRRIELEWVGDPSGAVLERLELWGPERHYPGPAGTHRANLGGVIHPSWYVRAGSRVSFEVDIPAESPRLDFYAGATRATARPTLRLIDGDRPYDLEIEPASDGWSVQSRLLTDWAGRRMRVELGAVGEGVALFGAPRITTAQPEGAVGVIVYLSDTLLATRLGAWGSRLEEVSPTLDRIAHEGVTFGRAISSSAWTKPAIASLMTGVSESTHKVGAFSHTDRLAESVPLLQERFAAAGYRTGSFAANPHGTALSGLDRGFDTAVLPVRWDGELGTLRHPSAIQVQASALRWIGEQPDQPFFAYLHTIEPHEYDGRAFRSKKRPPGWKPYDMAIRAQDDSMRRFLGLLASRGLDVILVFLSDHGEAFDDHGQYHGHGMTVYQEEIHVPLMFWSPGRLAPATINTPVSLLDVPTTLLELCGLPGLPDAQGRSLVPLMTGRGAPPARAVFASREWYVWDTGGPVWYSAVTPSFNKAILRSDGLQQVFDLTRDPCELRSLPWTGSDAGQQVAAWRDAQLAAAEAFARKYGTAEAAAVSASTAEQLKALGYVQ